MNKYMLKITYRYYHKIIGLNKIEGSKLIKNLTENVSPFSKELMGIKVKEVKYGKLITKLPYKNKFVGNTKIHCLHGGIIASLLDHTSGFTEWTVLPNTNYFISTVNININYLFPTPCMDLFAEGIIINKGNKLITTDAKIYTENKPEKILAISRATFNINKLPKGISINNSISIP